MTDKKTPDPIYNCKLKGFKDKTKPFKTERYIGPLWQHKTRMNKVKKNAVQS